MALALAVAGCATTTGGPGTAGAPAGGANAEGRVRVDGSPDTAGAVAREPLDWGLDRPGTGEVPRSFLAVTVEGQRAIVFINVETRRVFAGASVGWAPRDLLPLPDRQSMLVANAAGDRYATGTLSVISLSSFTETERLDLYPYGRPRGMVVTRNGVFLYVACEERRAVVEYNLLSRRVDRVFSLPRGVPYQVAINNTETRLFVTDGAGPYVYAIDLAGEQISEARVGNGPEGLAIAPDGSSLWVANRDDGTLTILDPNTMAEVGTVTSGRAPVRVVFTPDGNRVIVVNAGESAVVVFEPRSRGRIANIPVALYPLGIALDPGGTTAYVASTRQGEISVVDLVGNREVDRIPVGFTPIGVAWVERP